MFSQPLDAKPILGFLRVAVGLRDSKPLDLGPGFHDILVCVSFKPTYYDWCPGMTIIPKVNKVLNPRDARPITGFRRLVVGLLDSALRPWLPQLAESASFNSV